MQPVLEGWGWSKALYREAAQRMLASPRPLSHGVGMAVHEADDWSVRAIEPGLVFAVDPELFIPEEELYIRVEDTVLVTADGVENLTGSCPREIDDVESIVGEAGLLQHCPPVHINPGR
jgi:Xaa-Pro aminopeptidase